jgi:hypothetical protein
MLNECTAVQERAFQTRVQNQSRTYAALKRRSSTFFQTSIFSCRGLCRSFLRGLAGYASDTFSIQPLEPNSFPAKRHILTNRYSGNIRAGSKIADHSRGVDVNASRHTNLKRSCHLSLILIMRPK